MHRHMCIHMTMFLIFFKWIICILSFRNRGLSWAVVIHTFDPSTWELEAGRSPNSRVAWSTETGQPGLHREIVLQTKQKTKQGGWRGGSTLKSIWCECGRTGFHSKHLHGVSQPLVAVVPMDLTPFSYFCRHQAHLWYIYKHVGKMPLHVINKSWEGILVFFGFLKINIRRHKNRTKQESLNMGRHIWNNSKNKAVTQL